eukprot:TRINITY_DN28060_c0_g1_i1.p1 TRINITY_DN28060_c0_g1~~TRINITY_DN28060_c0_g1_i1.p1  ORF type:complete len:430 (+),score=81.37 TRINITY_DN28060_c0_g1_i1:50-1339(+)
MSYPQRSLILLILYLLIQVINGGILWQQTVPTGSNLHFTQDPNSASPLFVGLEAENLVSRSFQSGSLIWRQPLNFSYEGEAITPNIYFQGLAPDMVALYLYAEKSAPGGQILIWNYWETHSLTGNGKMLTQCDFSQESGGPVVDPASGTLFTSAGVQGTASLRVSQYSPSACTLERTADFPSSNANQFASGQSPVLVSKGGLATVTTQFTNSSGGPLALLISRFDLVSLETLWQASLALDGCSMAEQSSTSPNILVATDSSIFGGYWCTNTPSINILFKVDEWGALKNITKFEIPPIPLWQTLQAWALVFIDEDATQEAPCFSFSSSTIQCFSPVDLSPIFKAIPKLEGLEVVSALGGYVWYAGAGSLVGYTLSGLFSVPPTATYTAPPLAGNPTISQLLWVSPNLAQASPLALLSFEDKIALVQLQKN